MGLSQDPCPGRTSIRESPMGRTSMTRERRSGVVAFIASRLLRTRFNSTCWIWMRSPPPREAGRHLDLDRHAALDGLGSG